MERPKNLQQQLERLQQQRKRAVQRRDIISAILLRKKEAALRKKWKLKDQLLQSAPQYYLF